MIKISRKEWFETHKIWYRSVELLRINIENVNRGRLKRPYSSVYSYFENQDPDQPTDIKT